MLANVSLCAAHRTKPIFRWSQLHYSDADYFKMSRGESRIAKANYAVTRVPNLEQARTALLAMPAGTAIERRDQVFAFILLTCCRAMSAERQAVII